MDWGLYKPRCTDFWESVRVFKRRNYDWFYTYSEYKRAVSCYDEVWREI